MVRECRNCLGLEKALAQAIYERDEARQQAARATDLMMSGEALREKMKLESILTMDEKKAHLVYLVTGKRL